MTEHITIDELPEAVRENTDDIPWSLTGLDAGRIDKNECHCCGDTIYTVQSGESWVELDSQGEDRGFVMHLSDPGAMPQALDQERAQEQPLACGYCMESLFDYGYSEIHAIGPHDHTAALLDSGVINEHYMQEYDSAHRGLLWEQLLAIARGEEDVVFPAIRIDTGEESIDHPEGAMVDALAVAGERTDYYTREDYRHRDAFVDALREGRVELDVPVVVYSSSVYVTEHAADRVVERYLAFLGEIDL